MKELKVITEYCKSRLLMIGLLFSLPFVLNSSCSNEAEIDDGPVPFEVLRGVTYNQQNVVTCKFNYKNIEPGESSTDSLSGLELVIDTQTVFGKYITCDDSVSVNFEHEFVLAGMTTLQPTMVYTKTQDVEVENGRLYFRIEIIETFATVPTSAEYIVKIQSRDYLKYPVVFDVYWGVLE